MNKMKSWDEYEIKARYIPTFLSVVPFVHFLILFVGEAFWTELINNISWMLIIANLSLSLIVMLALVQIQCTLAKHWIEDSVFGKGGENFPTTNMLLYCNKLISSGRKQQMKIKINQLFGCEFSSESEEKDSPSNARAQAREAVGYVRYYVGKGIMTSQYNIRYGFFRNLLGGVIWGVIGSLLCSILYVFNSNWKAAAVFFVYLVIFLILFSLKKTILNNLSFSYADTLFSEFLSKK